MKMKYAFMLPLQVMKSKKLTSMEKLIIALLITSNQDMALTELSENFAEEYSVVEECVRELVRKKALVYGDGMVGLCDSLVFTCTNKKIKVKPKEDKDITHFEKVKKAFQKVFMEITSTATDKKAMAQLSNLPCASAPEEIWVRYFAAIRTDDFHQETKYKHITFEYVTRPQTIEKFWKFTNIQPQPQQQRKPLTLT